MISQQQAEAELDRARAQLLGELGVSRSRISRDIRQTAAAGVRDHPLLYVLSGVATSAIGTWVALRAGKKLLQQHAVSKVAASTNGHASRSHAARACATEQRVHELENRQSRLEVRQEETSKEKKSRSSGFPWLALARLALRSVSDGTP